MTESGLRRWHGDDVPTWQERWGVPELRIFERIGSTNDVARDLAEAGCPEGTLVLADAQTRGRGRRGRSWSAPPGASLSMSMVLRPPTPAAARILTLRLGLAATRALETDLPDIVRLKWPNDLMLGERKVGGILCEAALVRDRVDHVVAGMGINLRRPADGWPPEIAERATSLEAAGASPDTPALVGRIATEWLDVAAHPAESLSPDEQERFDARDALRGREVAVDDDSAGRAHGITSAGALIVRRGERSTEVAAGTVRALQPSHRDTR